MPGTGSRRPEVLDLVFRSLRCADSTALALLAGHCIGLNPRLPLMPTTCRLGAQRHLACVAPVYGIEIEIAWTRRRPTAAVQIIELEAAKPTSPCPHLGRFACQSERRHPATGHAPRTCLDRRAGAAVWLSRLSRGKRRLSFVLHIRGNERSQCCLAFCQHSLNVRTGVQQLQIRR